MICSLSRARAGTATVALLISACAIAPTETRPPPTVPAPARPAPAPNAPVSSSLPGAVAVAPPTPPAPPSRPSLNLFSRIRVPGDLEPSFQLSASGVQIFRCEPDKDGYHWAFRLPEADLRDSSGQVVAHHGAGYSFEHVDGSRLLGSIVGADSAPADGAVAWLLLQTRSFGEGVFDRIGYVQRIDTEGGLPPKQCSIEQSGQILRVHFSADFVFYRKH